MLRANDMSGLLTQRDLFGGSIAISLELAKHGQSLMGLYHPFHDKRICHPETSLTTFLCVLRHAGNLIWGAMLPHVISNHLPYYLRRCLIVKSAYFFEDLFLGGVNQEC